MALAKAEILEAISNMTVLELSGLIKDMEEKTKREAEEKAAKELAAKVAAEKKAARAPDKQKLMGFIAEYQAKATPDFRTQEAKDIVDAFLTGLSGIVSSFLTKVEALCR